RFYLLATIVLSLVIPIIKINFWQQDQAAIPVIKLLQAADSSNDTLDEIVCNMHSNNRNTAIHLFDALVSPFNPAEKRLYRVERN
ncbi:MAG: hypothetical protein Q7U24_09975, partial [Sulfurimicrobium sp.]|nr:hypothetical protein [Sulfurimicrobium sp.]